MPNRFIYVLVWKRDFFCLVQQVTDCGIEYGTRALQEAEGDEDNEDGDQDEQ